MLDSTQFWASQLLRDPELLYRTTIEALLTFTNSGSVKSQGSCPKVNLKCSFKSPSTCTWHRDCRSPQKCCPLNCGKHCLSSSDDPCTEKLETKPCSSPLNQWYFSTTKNRCVPLNNGICPEGRNNFKTFDICKKTCLAFGHGEPVKQY
ncbi:eppin-like [Sminthopsis crassicaudata]|uniref:eppin-like n=1 Tax=Sminthopsis crassicaudata TaxID=9301 RepID=UPI003D6909D2